MNRERIANIMLLTALAVCATAIVGCGGSKSTPPPALPPTTNNTQTYALGGQVDAPSPGTPLYQSQNAAEAFYAMNQSLASYGSANVTAQTRGAYAVAGTTQGTQLQVVSAPVQDTFHTANFQFNGQGNPNSDNFQITLQSSTYYSQDGGQYYFTYDFSVFGKQIYSTDQVALFRSANNQSEVLKIPYRGKNPTIYRYKIQQAQYGGYNPYQAGYGQQQQFQNPYQQQFQQIVVIAQTITTQLLNANAPQGGYNPYLQPGGGGYQQQQQYQQPYPNQNNGYPPGTFAR